ncbi:MAG: phage tail tape measure protein, partial [Synergistaceae bacterium]|nr:phage tail tape measure protein [Synergistaceae bacterium]
LRGALLRLAQEPKSVEKALKGLGIAAKNSRGKLRELPDLMTELQKKMKGWGEGKQMQYLANIFGVRAASGMLAVMRGVADGSLKELERLDKESSGIMQAVVENINKAAGSVVVSTDDMRAGIEKSEKQARRLGVSYDELQVYLGILAKQNIKGANADKILTQAFTRLIKKPKELTRALKKYDISAFDPDGKLWGLPTLLRDLDKALQGMGRADQLKAIEQIFGKGTGESILAMMQETVNGGFDSMTEQAKKTARGVSAIMAETRNDTLEGDLTRLSSMWGYFQIQIGDMFGPATRKGVQLLTQGIANLARLIEKFPTESKGIAYIVGALGGFKIAKSVWKIGSNLLKLPGAWLEVVGASASAEAAMTGNASVIGKALSGIMHPIDTLKAGFSGLWGLIMAHPFMALISVAALLLVYWQDICAAVQKAIDYMMGAQKLSQQEIKIKYSNEPALMRSAMTTGTMVNSQGQNKVSRTAEETATRVARTTGGRNKGGYQRRAAGGILTRPEFALVAEAGAEAIIPLTDKKRGSALWFETGRRLGMLDKIGLDKDTMPSMTNALKFKPDTDIKPENYNVPLHNISRQLGMLDNSGVMSSITDALKSKSDTGTESVNYNVPLHNISRQLGTLDNSGLVRDVMPSIMDALKFRPEINNVIPQPENSQAREGVPLWKAASEGVSFDRSVTNNTTNTSTTSNNTMPAFSPVVNLTVNGGESGIDGKIRSALNEYFEEAFMSFQSRMERVAFS